jgi:hypothetical protein
MTTKILTQEIADKLIYNHTIQEDTQNKYFEDNKGEVTPIYISVDYECTVSMSNYNVICKMLGHNLDALNDRGSIYGGRIEIEVGEEYPSELIDSLLGLEDYPLICDENHSDLEWTIIEQDSEELLDEYIYSDPITKRIEELRYIYDHDFQVWLRSNWTQYIDSPNQHIEYADFDIDFKEELDTDLVFQDFLTDYEKSQLALQGLEQTNFALSARALHN